MVGMIKKKISGSTLIEVLIAMVIIMIVFGIAMRIFGNVLSSGVSFKKIKAQNQLNLLLKEVQQRGYVQQTDLLIDSINYHLSIDTSKVLGLNKLIIKASEQGAYLGEVKFMYQVKEVNDEN